MKSLIYKGFGRNGNGIVKFNVSVVDDRRSSKILVQAFTSDQKIVGETYPQREGGDEPEEKIAILVSSDIWFPASFAGQEITTFCTYCSEFSDKEIADLQYGKKSAKYIQKFPIFEKQYDSMAEAVGEIKKFVVELRKEWKEIIDLHNKLVLEVRNFSIESLLDEAPLEITLSQTVVKK